MIYDIIVFIICICVLILYYISIQYKSVQTISLSCNDTINAYCEYFSARSTCFREYNKHICSIEVIKFFIYIMFVSLILYFIVLPYIEQFKQIIFNTGNNETIENILNKLKHKNSNNRYSLFILTFVISLLVIITYNIQSKNIGTIDSDYQEARKNFTEYMRQNDKKDVASQSPDYSKLREEIETNIKYVHNVKNPSYIYSIARENDNLLDYIYTNTEKRKIEKRPSLFYLKYEIVGTDNTTTIKDVIPNHLKYLFDDINIDFKNKNINYDLFMYYNQKIFGAHIINEIYSIDLIMIFIILTIHIFLMDYDYISLISICIFMFLVLSYIMIFTRK